MIQDSGMHGYPLVSGYADNGHRSCLLNPFWRDAGSIDRMPARCMPMA